MAIVFIPARGGSKSIPEKNIKLFYGMPLIYWAMAACSNAGGVSAIYVATDSVKIKEIVSSFNFEKVKLYDRRSENAEDNSSTESVMLEFIEATDFHDGETFMLVQATNPFITAFDIDEALNLYSTGNYDSILSVVRTKRFFWESGGRPVNYDYRKRPRRQDFEGILMENGSFYISSISGIKKNKNRIYGSIGIYEMKEYSGFEIDEPDDWEIAEVIMRKHITGAKDIKKVKLFISDVDGVLTDAGMYYTEEGDELKKFNTTDGMAFQLLREYNVKTAIITSEKTSMVERRACKMKVDYLFQGVRDKISIAKRICMEQGLAFDEVAYIGDDINDISLLSFAGIAACPGNAVKKVKSLPGILELRSEGGSGAVREFVEYLIEKSLV